MASIQVKRVLAELNAVVERQMVAFASSVLTTLTSAPSQGGTPRKTGWAASNWVINIGGGGTAVIGSKDSVNFSAQNASRGKLRGYRIRQGELSVDNNAPHIARLNAGSSTQAAPNFIQAAIARGVAAAAKVKK